MKIESIMTLMIHTPTVQNIENINAEKEQKVEPTYKSTFTEEKEKRKRGDNK